MKVGDRVMVSHEIVGNERQSGLIIRGQEKYAGEVGVVTEVYVDLPLYRISVDDSKWWWHKDSLILLEDGDEGR